MIETDSATHILVHRECHKTHILFPRNRTHTTNPSRWVYLTCVYMWGTPGFRRDENPERIRSPTLPDLCVHWLSWNLAEAPPTAKKTKSLGKPKLSMKIKKTKRFALSVFSEIPRWLVSCRVLWFLPSMSIPLTPESTPTHSPH